MWTRVLRRLAWLVVALIGAACTAPPAPRPDVIFILIDTLRADRLGCYGSERGVTPFLDSLAKESFVFRRAYAQSSWTNPSVASLFTSRFPSQHRATGKPRTSPAPAPSEVTLAEALRAHGYATAAFVANGGLFGRARGPKTPELGFAQGFDLYRMYGGSWVPPRGPKRRFRHTRAGEINVHALSWLAARSKEDRRPLFLYLHYMEPHSPYAPSPVALARVGRDRAALQRVNAHNWLWNRGDVDQAEVDMLADIYDAEVLSVDGSVRVLLNRLRRLGYLDHAIVIVTSDHGEEFRGHGRIGHGESLYESLIHVPLLIHVPGLKRRVDLPGVVSQIDVAPTLLEWVGAPVPESFQGHSLRRRMLRHISLWRRALAALGVDAGEPRVAISELLREADWPSRTRHRAAVISRSTKLIVTEDNRAEAYDLDVDPTEQRDGAAPAMEVASLRRTLADFDAAAALGDGEAVAVADPPPTLDTAAEERLRALGYDW